MFLVIIFKPVRANQMKSNKNKNKITFLVGILVAIAVGAIAYWGENSPRHAMSLAQAIEQGISN